jgi:hypothetical protein
MTIRITEDYVWSSHDEPRPPTLWPLSMVQQLLPQGGGEWNRDRLVTALTALHNALSEQFELKQRGGYMAEVLRRSPNWSAEVEELRLQQSALLAALQTLQQRTGSLPEGSKVDQQLHNDLDRWLRALSAHEHHESRLMQAAMYLEIGDMD